MHRAVLNAGIQIGMAGLRYVLQLYAFRHVSLTTVGELTLALSFVTSATFVAGFEMHQHFNRPLLLGEHGDVRGIGFRIILGTTVILALALAFPAITDVQTTSFAIALLFGAAVFEYANLELGRLLIIRGGYLTVAGLGALRALAPFVPALLIPLTLSTAMASWMGASLLSAAILGRTLRADTVVRRSTSPVTRSDFAPAARFFLIGGVTALLPLVERLCITRLFGLDALGSYALLFMFVGIGDLMLQGMVWQPFVRSITRRLTQPAFWRGTVMMLLGGTIGTYTAICIALLVLAPTIFAYLNKPLPADALVGAVLLYGGARASFTICFQTYYANHAERLLPYLQLGIAATVLLSYFVGQSLSLSLAGVLTLAACMWAIFPILAFGFFLPEPLRKRTV